MVHYSTSRDFVLKDKIQALVDGGVLTLNLEQKKIIANMVTLNFRTFPKMTVQDGLVPVPKARLDIINPMAEKQKAKGLISMTIGSGKIMWVHPDIVQDEQWETSKPNSKASHAMPSLLQRMTNL